MTEAPLWGDLTLFGLGVAISPLHIAVLLLLLLGPSPLRRGGLYVGAWLITTLLTVIALLTIGHGLVLDMTHGSHPRTGLDLLGGGALLSLAGKELITAITNHQEPPSWTQAVDRLTDMSLPLLLVLSAVIEVITPDDLLLFAKSASALLAAGLTIEQELLGGLIFTMSASILLILPLLAVMFGRNKVLPLLQQCKEFLYARGSLVVAGVSMILGSYLGWQGISGLIRI